MDKLDLILGKLEEMDKRFDSMDMKIDSMDKRIDSMDMKMMDGFKEVKHKLDVIKEQTAINTEYQYDMKQLGVKLEELETDVKLIKKAISNQ